MPHNDRVEMRLQLGTQRIDIGTRQSPYQFTEGGIEGLETPDFTAKMQEKAMLDGGICAAARVPSRKVTLQFEIAALPETEHHRAALISFFSPTANGMLTVTRNGVTRYIACRLAEGVTFAQKTVYHPVTVRVPLLCPDPYFYGETQSMPLRLGAAGLLWFPLTATEESGITGGVLGYAHSLSVDNTGDAEVGFHLVLSVTDGGGYTDGACEMTGITLAQRGRAEDRLTVNVSLAKGDTLEICTVPGAKYVRKNGVPCMQFSRESRFFALARGITTLDLSFATLNGKPEAALSFRPCYHGV